MNAIELYKKATHSLNMNEITIGEWEEQIAILKDVEPVKHGRWIDDRTDIVCSNCGTEYSDEIVFMNRNCKSEDLNYCPNCGAKMKL